MGFNLSDHPSEERGVYSSKNEMLKVFKHFQSEACFGDANHE